MGFMTTNIAAIPFIRTSEGEMSPRDVLIKSSQIKGLDTSVPGMEYGATLRFLTAIAAVAWGSLERPPRKLDHLYLDEGIVDRAIERLGHALDLYDPVQPFMQRPALAPKNAKDTTRKLEPGYMPPKKLLPSMPPDRAEQFWSLASSQEESMSLNQALRLLLIHHNYSMAGNNVYAGDKCKMGAPGIRFLGKDNTATEITVSGDNLLETLALNTSLSWVTEGGLPAWADRTASHSLNAGGQPTPLWTATWSSNTAATLWEDQRLLAVRIGGIPDEWYLPQQGKTDAERKLWWDQRNIEDPLYFYLPKPDGTFSAQRLDLSRDIIDLAVDWNAKSKGRQLRDRKSHKQLLAMNPARGDSLVFLRHQIGGTASSPSIRASEILVENTDLWAPDDDVAAEVTSYCEAIMDLHKIVTSPFRRKSAAERKMERRPPIFEMLEDVKSDASANFWRLVSQTCKDTIDSIENHDGIGNEAWIRATEAAKASFTATAYPRIDQVGVGVYEYVRASVDRRINAVARKHQSEKEPSNES